MKTCTRCHQEKSESEFYPHPSFKDGFNSVCKECVNKRRRKPNAQSGPYRVTPLKTKYLAIKVGGVHMQLHRHLMEQHLGRKLRPDENVHHINGDKHDNRIENLMVIPHAEHSRLENLGIPKRKGYKLSLATRQKMSESLKGNQRAKGKKLSLSPEQLKRRSDVMKLMHQEHPEIWSAHPKDS